MILRKPFHPDLRTLAVTVGVAFDADFGYAMAVYEGVRAWAARHAPGWRLLPLSHGFESTLAELVRSHRVGGLVGSFISDAWVRMSGAGSFPLVNVSQLSRVRSVPLVGMDWRGAGRRAAETLAAAGAGRYGFLGAAGQHAARELRAGFAEGLAEAGAGEPLVAPSLVEAHWAAWLEELGEGSAVLAAGDVLARRLVVAARRLGREVPADVAVMGVGQVPLESVYAGMTLTSLALPGTAIGEAAAEALAVRLTNPEAPPGERLLPPGPVVRGESTRAVPGRDAAVERALAYAAAHLEEPLSVDELAREAGVSRRGLEVRFRASLGRAPYEAVQGLRRERAEELLRGTDLPVQDVARACGFPTQHPFSAAFKKWTGLSPRAWRAGPQPGPGG